MRWKQRSGLDSRRIFQKHCGLPLRLLDGVLKGDGCEDQVLSFHDLTGIDALAEEGVYDHDGGIEGL